MNSGARQKVRMSNLADKQKHANFESIEDKTILNYLALAEAILDVNPSRDNRKYIARFYDEEESKKRIKEIEELRKNGKMTDAERQDKIEKMERYRNKVLKEIEKIKNQSEFMKNKYAIKKIKIKNKYAGTEEIFENLKLACEEYDLNYNSIKVKFSSKKSNKIMHKGLIIERI